MPFKSEDQRKWMYANKPEMAKRWEKHTPKGKLPKKVGECGNPRMTEVFKINELTSQPTTTTQSKAPTATQRADALTNMTKAAKTAPVQNMTRARAGQMMKDAGDEMKTQDPNAKVQVASTQFGGVAMPFVSQDTPTANLPSGMRDVPTSPINPFNKR